MPKTGIAVLVSILIATSLFAQNNRSAVSLTGSDTATCTVPDPCRTFDVAISKTNPGGEVIVLSSAGYGPFTVNKSVSIISPPAYHAAIAPAAGNAITVSVDSAVVVLRGLTITGGFGGGNGIAFTGQTSTASNTKLYIDHCVISGFPSRGINFARNGTLFVAETTVRQSGSEGILIDGSPGFPSQASIDHILVEENFDGLRVENATVAIRDSVAAENSDVGFFAFASQAGSTADLSANNCQATHNTDGFFAGSGAGTAQLAVSNSVASLNIGYGVGVGNNGTVRASSNIVIRNSNGFVQNGSGVFRSRANNTVDGNTTADTNGTITTFGST